MTRAEHLAWCKERALAYADQGDNTNAIASMASDMSKHPRDGEPRRSAADGDVRHDCQVRPAGRAAEVHRGVQLMAISRRYQTMPAIAHCRADGCPWLGVTGGARAAEATQ